MKPRLSYEKSVLYKTMQWYCRGKGAMGLGDTPKEAYWVWKYFLEKHGIKGDA